MPVGINSSAGTAGKPGRWRLANKISKQNLSGKQITPAVVVEDSEVCLEDEAPMMTTKALVLGPDAAGLPWHADASLEAERLDVLGTAAANAALFQAAEALADAACDEHQITLQKLCAWKAAVQTAWLALAYAHPKSQAIHRSCPSSARGRSVKRKPVPTTVPDEEEQLSGRMVQQRKFEVLAGTIDPAYLSPKLHSGLIMGKMRPMNVCEHTPVDSSERSKPHWLSPSTLPYSPCTPTPHLVSQSPQRADAEVMLNVAAKQDEVDPLSSFSMERSVSHLSDFSTSTGLDYGDRMADCYQDAEERPSDESSCATSSGSLSDFLSTPNLGGTSSIASSPRTHNTELGDDDELAEEKPWMMHRFSPSRPQRNPERCQVRVPISLKKTIRDQRWSPFRSLKQTDDLEGEEESDPDLDHLFDRKIHPKRKGDDTMGMLDFLASGPPA